jgi:hypothetical protein
MIDSAMAGTAAPSRILIIDNGTELQDSLAQAGRVLPGNVEVYDPGENIGVAGAWNVALKWANGPVVITNDDFVFAPESLARFEAAVRPGEPQLVCGDGWACFLQTPELTEKVGFYDENYYPAYWEDRDYSIRMSLAGLATEDIDIGAFRHEGSATIKTFNDWELEAHAHAFDANRALFASKWRKEVAKDVTISFIIPTLGRPTLERTLRSMIQAGIAPTDQVIVVSDGERPEVEGRVRSVGLPCEVIVSSVPFAGDTGNTPRNAAMKLATRTHLHFMDDDDVYTPGAITFMREETGIEPMRLHVFKFTIPSGEVVPREPSVYYGNLSTHSLIYPNQPAKLSYWGVNDDDQDFAFISETIKLHAGEHKRDSKTVDTRVAWHDFITCVARPKDDQ